MKLVCFTNQIDIKDESKYINTLFDNGLEVLHFKKNTSTLTNFTNLLNLIKPEYLGRIALHHHHNLASNFNIKRLHFSEEKRKNINIKNIENLLDKFILSTSIHNINEYHKIPNYFDYCFYGPIFNSISKQNYTPLIDFKNLEIGKKTKTKLYAIGGINPNNILGIKTKGFDGIALLGCLWNNPEKSLENFLAIKKICQA